MGPPARLRTGQNQIRWSSRATTLTGFFILPPLIYALANISPSTGFAFVGFLAGQLFLIAIGATNRLMWVATWVGLVVWQNFWLGVISHVRGVPPDLFSVEIKTAAAAAMFALTLLNKLSAWPGSRQSQILVGLFLGVVLLGAARNPGVEAVTYLRNFCFLPLGVYIFYHLFRGTGLAEVIYFLRRISIMVITACTVGVLVEVIFGGDAWAGLTGQEFLTYKGNSADETTLAGLSLTRLTSISGSGVTLSLTLSVFVIILLATGRRSVDHTFVFVGLCVALASGGKGGISLILAFAIFVVLQNILTRFQVNLRVLVFAILGTVLLATLYLALSVSPKFAISLLSRPDGNFLSGDSVSIHLAGFLQAAYGSGFSLLGRGLGTSGVVLGGQATNVSTSYAGNDSALGALLVQLGWLGFLVYLLLVARILAPLPSGRLKVYAVAATIALLCAMVLQEEPAGPAVTGPLTMLLAISMTKSMPSEQALRRP